MLRIAVCDDQPRELEIIGEYITEYLGTHTLEAETKEFSHPDALLTAIEVEKFSFIHTGYCHAHVERLGAR